MHSLQLVALTDWIYTDLLCDCVFVVVALVNADVVVVGIGGVVVVFAVIVGVVVVFVGVVVVFVGVVVVFAVVVVFVGVVVVFVGVVVVFAVVVVFVVVVGGIVEVAIVVGGIIIIINIIISNAQFTTNIIIMVSATETKSRSRQMNKFVTVLARNVSLSATVVPVRQTHTGTSAFIRLNDFGSLQ